MNLDVASTKIDRLLAEIVQHAGFRLSYSIRPEHRQDEQEQNNVTLSVIFDGHDVPLLLAHRAELLLALEHLAVKAIGLASEDHDQISFDAGGFKAERDRRLEMSARKAILQVRTSGVPYHFPPMNSRERRLLHLALTPSGLRAVSEGEEPQRHLVLHPGK